METYLHLQGDRGPEKGVGPACQSNSGASGSPAPDFRFWRPIHPSCGQPGSTGSTGSTCLRKGFKKNSLLIFLNFYWHHYFLWLLILHCCSVIWWPNSRISWYPGSWFRIRIKSGQLIRIRIPDPDMNPGWLKWPKKVEKNYNSWWRLLLSLGRPNWKINCNLYLKIVAVNV